MFVNRLEEITKERRTGEKNSHANAKRRKDLQKLFGV
jgi:hypothetical protein